MSIDWNIFWSALVGTTLPALGASLVMLLLTYRTNRELALLKGDLDKRAAMFSVWHQKRINALVETYEAFRVYLDFLRRALYIPTTGKNLDPMWDFRTSIERNLVYLDTATQREIQTFQSELLVFWNWAHEQQGIGGEDHIKAVQQRLDFEIPGYLEKLRKVINIYASPGDAEQPDPTPAQQSALVDVPATTSRRQGRR